MEKNNQDYPARFDVEYQENHDRLTSLVRIILAIPILVVLSVLGGDSGFNHHAERAGGGLVVGLSLATALMIIFQQAYPRWWFDFALEYNRFSARVAAYMFLLRDEYPSTVDKQSVRLDVDYPNVQKDLNNLMPLVKWFLAIPHYICLFVLLISVAITSVIAWFAILFTGRYPRSLFDFAVGVGRWFTRVNAYMLLLTTDKYPPFSLK